jgi:hypothetical protein
LSWRNANIQLPYLGHVPGPDPPCRSVPGGPGRRARLPCEEGRPASGATAVPWLGCGNSRPWAQEVDSSTAARSASLTTKAPNSAGLMCMGSASCCVSHSDSSGVARVSVMSRASVLTMPAGVCAGAQIPYQIGKSKPATPACVSRKPHRLFHPERIRRGLAGGGPSRQVIAGRAVLRGDSGAGILGRTAQAAPCQTACTGA